MNISTSSRHAALLLGIVSLSGLLAGCDRQQPKLSSRKNICDGYGGLATVLAEQTLRCTGTIGPDSFEVQSGRLKERFTICDENVTAAWNKLHPQPSNALDNVREVLSLQDLGERLPGFQKCLTDRFTRWSAFFKRTGINTCPKWELTKVSGVGDAATAKQRGKMQPKLTYVPALPQGADPTTVVVYEDAPGQPGPGKVVRESELKAPERVAATPDQQYVDIVVPAKSSLFFNIDATATQSCDDPAVCAAQCAAFLPGFVVSAARNEVVADPAEWLTNTTFSRPCGVAFDRTSNPNPDYYCAPDYVHQMSVNSTLPGGTVPPGDRFGVKERGAMGEHCLKWFPSSTNSSEGVDYETDLLRVCINPASNLLCYSRCGN